MRYIKTYEDLINNFIPLDDEKRIYYKIHTNNSIRKLEIALDKLGIKKMFYRFFNHDSDIYKRTIENNAIIYLLIDFYTNKNGAIDNKIEIITDEVEVDPKFYNFNNRKYGGEIFVTDQDVEANKYNL